MKRIGRFAAVALVVAASIVAISPGELSVSSRFELGETLLRLHFEGLQDKTSEAAASIAQSPGFERAASLVGGPIDGVAVLNLETGKPIVWAGRTFDVDPSLDLDDAKRGLETHGILAHPAYRVLFSAKLADGAIAIAFAQFDQRLPQRHDLAEDLAQAAGLHRMDLRYAADRMSTDETQERPTKVVVLDGLVHATMFAHTPDEAKERSDTERNQRLRVAAILFAGILAAAFLRRRDWVPLTFAVFAVLLYSHDPWWVMLVGAAAVSLRPFGVGPARYVFALVGMGLLIWFLGAIGKHSLFDSASAIPHWDAALFIGGAALATFSWLRFTANVFRLKHPRGRPERALAAAACTAAILLGTFRLEFRSAEPEKPQTTSNRLRTAVKNATDPSSGQDIAVAETLLEKGDPKDLAFLLWSAAKWDPSEPCAVEIYDGSLQRVSRFDLDAPPSSLLPPPPTDFAATEQQQNGRGRGESIRYWTQDVPLHAISAPDEPVGVARFCVPFRNDLARAGVRAPIFSTPPRRKQTVSTMFALSQILVIVGVALVLYFLVRRRQMQWAFRHVIAFFLVVASIIPIVFIGVLQIRAVGERHEKQHRENLVRDTEMVATMVQNARGPVDNDWCVALSRDHRIDVNIYKRETLVATSRPGLWDTGILGRQLAAPAYLALIRDGGRKLQALEPFAATGELHAGYRRQGSQRVVVVPQLTDRKELARTRAEEQAKLVALYLLAVAFVVGLAIPIANVLIRPVRRLEVATRAVAAGDLDVELPNARGAGELSALVRSFGDMTRRLRDAKDLAARAERAAAWREMAQQIAHDVKNPLTPMKLTLQNLQALATEDPELFHEEFDRGCSLILNEIDKLQRTASNFSTFARQTARNTEPVDVAVLLTETAELHGAADAIAVSVELADERAPLIVHADRDELSRVLHNLLTNAREAGAKNIVLRGRTMGDSTRIEVVDDGPGIAPEAMDRIFEPSFTTRTSGTGLGLPIVKQIIDDLGGTVAIESTPGQGTTVTLLLP